MYVAVITLFPEMFDALNYGIVKRAADRSLVKIEYYNPRDYTTDNYRRIDDKPYGGGAGMVMLYQPLQKTIQTIKIKHPKAHILYLSPQGRRLTQSHLHQLTAAPDGEYILLCGRYEGIDQRLLNAYVDMEYSIGDYILTGGEIPAMVLIDGMVRLLPHALNPESVQHDSFSCGLLEHPHYTRPFRIDDQSVPDSLISGNHHAIEMWRLKESLKNTWQKRPDLVKKGSLNKTMQALLNQIIKEQHHE
jgi:tRNA (guanine37-N1)-methyltransferase